MILMDINISSMLQELENAIKRSIAYFYLEKAYEMVLKIEQLSKDGKLVELEYAYKDLKEELDEKGRFLANVDWALY